MPRAMFTTMSRKPWRHWGAMMEIFDAKLQPDRRSRLLADLPGTALRDGQGEGDGITAHLFAGLRPRGGWRAHDHDRSQTMSHHEPRSRPLIVLRTGMQHCPRNCLRDRYPIRTGSRPSVGSPQLERHRVRAGGRRADSRAVARSPPAAVRSRRSGTRPHAPFRDR